MVIISVILIIVIILIISILTITVLSSGPWLEYECWKEESVSSSSVCFVKFLHFHRLMLLSWKNETCGCD